MARAKTATYAEVIGVRLEPRERAKLEMIAKATDRTMSDVMRAIVRKIELTGKADIRLGQGRE